MKFQLSTATLLFAVTCGSIALGGSLAAWRIAVADDKSASVPHLFGAMLYLSPWWLPLVFVGYVLGQRRLTAKATMAFAALEAASVGGMVWAISIFN
jgi:hypothetical protein